MRLAAKACDGIVGFNDEDSGAAASPQQPPQPPRLVGNTLYMTVDQAYDMGWSDAEAHFKEEGAEHRLGARKWPIITVLQARLHSGLEG